MKTTKTPAQRLREAYAQPEQPRTRRLESLAQIYTPDAKRDELLQLKATDLAAYNRLPKAIRQDLGYYASSRDAAAQLEEMKS